MTDIEIARNITPKPINDILETYGFTKDSIYNYGPYMAKITKDNPTNQEGDLILVTSINPTPYGEGKTTISIGLCDGLNALGKKTISVLREPSLGPVFGIKGGATGGGRAQIAPMEDINLHFNGDFHEKDSSTANDIVSPFSYTPTTTKTNASTAMPTTAQV